MNEETELLESAIAKGDAAIYEAQAALNNLHRKQSARRQELGYQKAMAGLKLARVSETPVEGARMIAAQTDAGIVTSWITPRLDIEHWRERTLETNKMKNDDENTQSGSDCQKRLVSGSFTPGPWFYNGATEIYDMTGATISELYINSETIPECRANARLIASAPDMLAALESIISTFEGGESVEGHCICNARTAIERAYGNSPSQNK